MKNGDLSHFRKPAPVGHEVLGIPASLENDRLFKAFPIGSCFNHDHWCVIRPRCARTHAFAFCGKLIHCLEKLRLSSCVLQIKLNNNVCHDHHPSMPSFSHIQGDAAVQQGFEWFRTAMRTYMHATMVNSVSCCSKVNQNREFSPQKKGACAGRHPRDSKKILKDSDYRLLNARRTVTANAPISPAAAT